MFDVSKQVMFDVMNTISQERQTLFQTFGTAREGVFLLRRGQPVVHL